MQIYTDFLIYYNIHSVLFANNCYAYIYDQNIVSGHNGAGKSTLVNMCIGMTGPDDICTGDFHIYGISGRIAMDEIRKNLGLGVCLQQDLLFKQFTVRHHLLFYCQLKVGVHF